MTDNFFDINSENIVNFSSNSSFVIKADYNQIIDYNTPLFRYFELLNFICLLKNKENKLIKPEKWDDKYENLLLQQILETSDGR
jgi:hypothetical protein